MRLDRARLQRLHQGHHEDPRQQEDILEEERRVGHNPELANVRRETAVAGRGCVVRDRVRHRAQEVRCSLEPGPAAGNHYAVVGATGIGHGEADTGSVPGAVSSASMMDDAWGGFFC
jgi:hypothetical protein